MSVTAHIKKKLSHFDLDIHLDNIEGFSSLIGFSGSGKSMTLKCIAGIETPDEGQIIVNDKVLFDSEKRINVPVQERKIGYLFQNYALFPNMTVAENILISQRKESKEEKDKILKEMLSLMQLEGHEDKYPNRLSGGQQQRVALARILVSKPELLLLDEPFTALDAYLREKMQMEIKELLASYQHDVIMVTHDRDEAYRMGEYTGVLHDGHLLVYKKTEEVFNNPETGLAAQLTGCKNIVPIRKVDENKLEIIPWHLTIHTDRTIPNETTHIGIRAHYFKESDDPKYAVKYVGDMQDAFEKIVKFRYVNQSEDSNDIWWKIPNESIPESLPEALEFNEEAILFLKGGEIQ